MAFLDSKMVNFISKNGPFLFKMAILDLKWSINERILTITDENGEIFIDREQMSFFIAKICFFY